MEENINMDLKDIYEAVNKVYLPEDVFHTRALLNTVINFLVS